ncbi:phage tail tape measure protein, partial [Sinirhodobacter populi]
AIDLLNGLVTKANDLTAKVGIPAMPTMDRLDTDPTFSNPYAGSASDMGGAISGAASDAFNTDYIGAASDALSSFTDKLTATITGTEAVAAKTGAAAAGIGKVGSAATEAEKKVDELAKKLDDLGENSIKSLGSELATLAVDGKANFGDLAKSIIKSLLDIAIQVAIVKPLLSFMGFASGGAFGGAAGGAVTASASGNVFDSGLTKFAAGGTFTNSIVNTPTPFKFASGGGFGLGVMGEAGPEAVMPLVRGPDGSLGVQMHGNGAARSDEPQTSHVTISVEAGEYFDARVKDVSGNVAADVMTAGMKQLDRELPARVSKITSAPRRR